MSAAQILVYFAYDKALRAVTECYTLIYCLQCLVSVLQYSRHCFHYITYLDVSILPLHLLNISLVVNFAALTLYFA